jgi:hypothetical protein
MAWVTIGSGTLNKSTKDTGAPYFGKGKIEINGEEHEFNIGAWVKEGKNGSKFFSIAFSVQEDAAPKSAPKKQEEESDGIPF